jgi:hypothetical protein
LALEGRGRQWSVVRTNGSGAFTPRTEQGASVHKPLDLRQHRAHAVGLIPVHLGSQESAVREADGRDALELLPSAPTVTCPEPTPIANLVSGGYDLDGLDLADDLEDHEPRYR